MPEQDTGGADPRRDPRPAGSSGALRLGFAGTPGFAATILEGLMAAGRTPVVVYTQPDRRKGRGRQTAAPPVKVLAEARGLEVRQPASLRGPEAAAVLTGYDLDVLVVAAYGLILPPGILGVPRLGCINVHASLLPRWRGAAPVERAIMAGDRETGVSIMRMDRGLDTGPVYLTRSCPISPATDGAALEEALAHLGTEALLECLDRLPGLQPVAQPADGATYAAKLTRDDARIHWGAPAADIDAQVRALRHRLPAFTFSGTTQVAVLEARSEPADSALAGRPAGTILTSDAGGIRVQCGSDVLVVSRLKLSIGKGRPLSAADARNGYPELFAAGIVLGQESGS